MHFFLYEWITGGGLVEQSGRLPSSLLSEGSAMIAALAADFAALPRAQVTLLRDIRLESPPPRGCEVVEIHSESQWRQEFAELAAKADQTLVVAPEFDGILTDTLTLARTAGARLLNVSDEFAALAADKHATATRMTEAGVRAPHGRIIPADACRLPADFEYPAVIKPLVGAGSQHTLLVDSHLDEPPPYPWARRLERFCPGRAASVGAVCGHGGFRLLPPCWQTLSADGRFKYRGGSLIWESPLARRALELAARALAALPRAHGYVGVDLVLGEAQDSSEDTVIEINPRVTTSYVGLRRAVRQNLAQVMLDMAAGDDAEITVSNERVAFEADGQIWHDE